MNKSLHTFFTLLLVGASTSALAHWSERDWGNQFLSPADQSAMPLNPTITYNPPDSTAEYPVAPSGESYLPITPERFALHMQHHDYFPVITAVIPPFFSPPVLDTIDKYLITPNKMVVINPGGEEIIHVMEGKRHGFTNMSISITNTLPGNGAPMHTHLGEEAHVVLKGSMRYFLKDKVFTVNAPYIVHIPSMTPHAFQNIGTSIINIVGVFGSNEWQYDVLGFPPFPENVNANTSTCKFVIKNEWDKGATAVVSIKNSTAQAVSGWSANWLFTDGSTRVVQTWNASVKGANPYTATSLNWNKNLGPGQTVQFEMLLSKADSTKRAQMPKLEGPLCKD